MAIGDVIARLSVSLGLETAAFEKGAKRASNSASQLQTSMKRAGNFVAGAFAFSAVIDGLQKLRDATREAVDVVGGLGEQAAQVGVTTDALQEYRYIATQVGVSTEEMDAGFGQLTKRLGEAAQGSKEPTEALKRLGLSLDDIKGKTAGDVIPLIADGLKNIKDPAEQAAIVVDLFGKAGQKLLPLLTEGAAGIQKMIDAAKEMGLVLTPEEIANADKYGDAMAALDAKVGAQLSGKLAKNAEALYEFETAIANIKGALIDAIGGFKRLTDSLNDLQARGHAALVRFSDSINGAMQRAHTALVSGLGYIANFYYGVKSYITDKLNAVWAGVTAKVEQVKHAFFTLYDAVVGHSYIPDMVDGIGQHMARLDGLMVGKAKSTTEKAAEHFQKLRNLLDDLFPEVVAGREYRDARGTIENDANLTADEKAEALFRLGQKTGGVDRNTPVPLSDDVMNQGSLMADAMQKVSDKLDIFGKKAGVVTVNVAKSFKDMADATISSLQNLSNSIKGGGFLDILSSVIGFGLQLGSIGAFGKTIAGRINAPKVPGYAGGTNFHPGGLAVVGERGPELVSMPRGSRVTPNGEWGGQRLKVEVVANNNGFGAIVRNHAGQVVAEAAPSLMQGGAKVAQSQIAYRNTRRVA